MRHIQIKRVYDPVLHSDGKRILVDRLWPRGLTKEQVAVEIWMKEIAPSTDLRKQFNHKPVLFEQFKKEYLIELGMDSKQELLHQIRTWAETETVTLVYAAKDAIHNHANVLKEVLE